MLVSPGAFASAGTLFLAGVAFLAAALRAVVLAAVGLAAVVLLAGFAADLAAPVFPAAAVVPA